MNQGRALIAYFEEAVQKSGDAKSACNWITQDILRILKDNNQAIAEFPISAAALGDMISAINDGKLPKPRAKDAFELMLSDGLNVVEAIQKLGIEQVDESALVDICRELLAKNPKIVADVQGGKVQAVSSLIGQARKLNPNIDPGRFREICLELISSGQV